MKCPIIRHASRLMNQNKEFPETEPKTLAQTATRAQKTYYANLGIDLSKYTCWDELNEDIWVTERESVFPEDSYQARVEYADSQFLAVRAFIHNIFEHFTL